MTTPQTRSPKRSARPAAGRPSGRFARASQPSGRASRPRPARSSSPPTGRRVPGMHRRKPEPPSTAKRVLGAAQSAPKSALGAIGGLLPGGSGAKKGGKAKKAGRGVARTAQDNKKPLGVALVAGAAGLALSQRDRIAGKLGRGGGDEGSPEPQPPALDPHEHPAAPAAPPPPPAPGV